MEKRLRKRARPARERVPAEGSVFLFPILGMAAMDRARRKGHDADAAQAGCLLVLERVSKQSDARAAQAGCPPLRTSLASGRTAVHGREPGQRE